MKKSTSTFEETHEKIGLEKKLRQNAEQLLLSQNNDISKSLIPPTIEDMSKLIHELQVHQIELEMQNDELARSQIEVEALHARYFDLYDLAPVGYCTLSELGIIIEANLTLSTLLGVTRDEVINKHFTHFIIEDDQDIYYHHRIHHSDLGNSRKTELRLYKKDKTFFWAGLTSMNTTDPFHKRTNRLVIDDITAQKKCRDCSS